jgi:NADH-quinone oxidoreductase subunit J
MMPVLFYAAALTAVVSTVLVVTGRHAVHALLYLIGSLLSVAIVFFALGAPFAGALEIIIYAGAIMVLFVFVVMMLNAGKAATDREERWSPPRAWAGPALLVAVLAAELFTMLWRAGGTGGGGRVGVERVALAMFGPYALAVELAALLLLVGLLGAYHLGRPSGRGRE